MVRVTFRARVSVMVRESVRAIVRVMVRVQNGPKSPGGFFRGFFMILQGVLLLRRKPL